MPTVVLFLLPIFKRVLIYLNRSKKGAVTKLFHFVTAPFISVPGMAYILLVKVQSQVSTTKCSEPQVEIGNDGMKEVV